jgi:hypothetical protein
MADDIFKDTDQGNVFYLYRTGDISNGSTAINHFHHRTDLKDFRGFVKIKSAKKMCNKLVEKSLEVSDKFINFQYIRIKNGKPKRKKLSHSQCSMAWKRKLKMLNLVVKLGIRSGQQS